MIITTKWLGGDSGRYRRATGGAADIVSLIANADADVETYAQESRADQHAKDEPLNLLSSRRVASDVSCGRRDRLGQICPRRFNARPNCRLRRRSRFEKHALRGATEPCLPQKYDAILKYMVK